jgi:hypothetical protein
MKNQIITLFLLLLFGFNTQGQIISQGYFVSKAQRKVGGRGLKQVVLSNDVSRYAIAKKNRVAIYKNNHELVKNIKTNLLEINQISFTKDDKYILAVGTKNITSKKNAIEFINVGSGIVEKEIFVDAASIFSLDISADGNFLVITCSNKDVQVYDLNASQFLYSFKNGKEQTIDAAFSGDGKYVFSGGSGRVIYGRKMNSDSIIYVSEKAKGWIRTINPLKKNNLIFAGTDKGQIIVVNHVNNEIKGHLVNVTKKRQILSITNDPNEKFIFAVTSSKKLIALEVASRKILVTRKIKALGGSTTCAVVHPFFYSKKQSTILTTNLNSNKILFWNFIHPTYQNEDTVQSEILMASDKNPPSILITSPKLNENIENTNAVVFSETITLKGVLQDETGIYKAYLNGNKIVVGANGVFKTSEIKLVMGENKFVLEATDPNNLTSSKKFSIFRKELTDDDLLMANNKKKNYLLTISINQYSQWPPLNNAVQDAKDFREVLIAKYGFEPENIISIEDTLADRKNIYDAFKTLAQKIGPYDNLIIYYSGHGLYDPTFNEGYWIPYNAAKNSESDYISNSNLLSYLKAIDSKHTFLIADACFSGALFSDAKRGYADNVGQFKSRWGFTSGSLEYVSDGSAGGNSPFAKNLIEFLKNNSQEKLEVSTLIQNVKIKVGNETNQKPIGSPLKNVGDEGGEFIFEIKK